MPQKPITSYFKPKNNGAEIVKPSKRKAEEKKSPRPMKRKAVQFNENFLDLPHKAYAWKTWSKVLQQKVSNFTEFRKLINSFRPNKKHFTLHNFEGFINDLSESKRKPFFEHDLPFIQKLALMSPQLFPMGNITRMVANRNCEITLTKLQCACILALSFFGLLYRRKGHNRVNILHLLANVSKPGGMVWAKYGCILSYFNACRMRGVDWLRNRNVTFHRRNVPDNSHLPVSLAKLFDDKSTMGKVDFRPKGTIEDADFALQVDFANKYIGGGVLGNGCVQEEIRFLISPECLITCFLCPKLLDHETVVVIGAERYSSYKGYASDFQFDGQFIDGTPLDSINRVQTYIVAIDAMNVSHYYTNQWDVELRLRELKKAFAGFSVPKEIFETSATAIASGNWGCGVFKGDPHLKFCLQWIASTLSGRDLIYFSFDDDRVTGIPDLVKKLQAQKWTVSKLWTEISDFSACKMKGKSDHKKLFKYLHRRLEGEEDSDSESDQIIGLLRNSSPIPAEREPVENFIVKDGEEEEVLSKESPESNDAEEFYWPSS